MHRTNSECGNSSVGRARPCQGRGREFEPRFPLQTNGVLAKRLCTGLQIHVARFDSGTRLHNHPTQLVNHSARVVESVDTRDLKSLAFRGVPVQVWPRAPFYGRENNSKKQSRKRLFLYLKFVTVLIVVKKFLKKDRTLSFY